jgi:hypothetical protein
VLRQVLPASIADVPSSFEAAGHVAHLNLREEVPLLIIVHFCRRRRRRCCSFLSSLLIFVWPQVLPYKALIARVILDKNPRIK